MKTFWYIIIGITVFLIIGADAWLSGKNLGPAWLPWILVCIPAAAVLGLSFSKYGIGLFREWQRILHTGIKMALAGGALCLAVLGGNFATADRDSAVKEQTEIIDKFKKKHTRHRRVRRGCYIPNGHYYSYHITVRFKNGKTKDLELNESAYRKARIGKTRTIEVGKGIFSIPMIVN